MRLRILSDLHLEESDLKQLLARLAGCRPVGQDPSPHARPTEPGRPDRLVAGLRRCLIRSRKKGDDATGPNPTDRGKPGTKRHIMVDRAGIPLAVVLTGANRHDSMALTLIARVASLVWLPRINDQG